jgi:hypothetical protein
MSGTQRYSHIMNQGGLTFNSRNMNIRRMNKRETIRTVADLVTAFGGNKAMGDWADVGETAVCNWKDANEIPRGYHLRLWLEVERRGLSVDPDLFGVAEYVGAKRRQRPDAHA